MSLLLLLIPLIAAGFVLVARPSNGRQIALLITLANLALTAYVVMAFQSGGGDALAFRIPWVPNAGISFSLSLDGISLLLVVLTNLLAPIIVLSSFGQTYEHENRYYGMVLMMLGALNGVFMAEDGLLFYVFYELALIPIYFICAIWGGQDRIRVTLKFFIYTFIGSLFMLMSLIYVYLQTGDPLAGSDVIRHSFLWRDLVAVPLSPATAWWVMLGFFVAFAVKMPIFPFHTWQPDTYTTAPTGGTMLLSGIMLKMGVYGVIRWMVPLAPEAMHTLVPTFMTLAIIGIVYASIIAVKQSDFKRLIAYSSIAHVGLIAAGVFAWNKTGVQGSMIQMFNHGTSTAMLFLLVGVVYDRVHHRWIIKPDGSKGFGGIASVVPFYTGIMAIALFASLGLPGLSGFISEALVFLGAFSNPKFQTYVVIGSLGILLGAAYLLWMFMRVFLGPLNEEHKDLEDMNWRETFTLIPLCALVIILGVYPMPVLNLMGTTIAKLLTLFS
jgi:NADH-quinone oxidoreductase subunit M